MGLVSTGETVGGGVGLVIGTTFEKLNLSVAQSGQTKFVNAQTFFSAQISFATQHITLL